MSYIEFMRKINEIVEWVSWGEDDSFEELIEYIKGTSYAYGIKLNSDLEVIQLIEIAKVYKINHI